MEEENSAKCILSRYKDFFFDATQAERIRRAVEKEEMKILIQKLHPKGLVYTMKRWRPSTACTTARGLAGTHPAPSTR
ncbi:hypothetical protein EVAR_95756_1 [Eumeta japonica]|uniref:Uncharacterized protein n=1 Tax=Eumeta variegata TaxID=151549 RepID=A0A4C1ULC7_EUMVA|nr:hypothetical protein EVAR_95756_1 [Eumeta japonica]